MKKQVIAYLHTHWDREWYRTYEEFNLRLIEVMDEILDELECGAAPCFYLDGQVSALESYSKFRDKNLERVKKLIAAKKLFIGPFLVSATAFYRADGI
jgi:mannosylglycerate hydrolase